MNILFPTGSFYPSQQGGPCNSVYALAKGLVQAGHTVRVITTNFDIPESAGIPFDQWTQIDGIHAYYMSFPEGITPMKINARVLMRPGRLISILESTACDMVHAAMLFTVISHYTAEYGRIHGIPVIWSPRGSMLPYTFSRGTLKKALFLSMPRIRRGLTGCHFHATSDEEAHHVMEFMAQYSGENINYRIHNIPNLVDDEVFVRGSDMPPYPFKYMLHLGRVHPKKRLENLIAALPVAKIDLSTKLVIAGWTGEDSGYSRMLKSLVAKLGLGNRIIFTDKRIEGLEKARLYRHAEVFVLPSESENFGMVVVESLAQGVPVVASNKTPWQVLEERGAGYWVCNDPESIAESLTRFFALNEHERKTFSANSLILANEYSRDVLIGRYLDMYEQVASSGRSLDRSGGNSGAGSES